MEISLFLFLLETNWWKCQVIVTFYCIFTLFKFLTHIGANVVKVFGYGLNFSYS